VRPGFSIGARVPIAADREVGGESGSTSGSTITGGPGLTVGGTVDVDPTDESDLEADGTVALGSMAKSVLDALALGPRGG